MKIFRKIAAAVLVLTLCLSLCCTVSAAETQTKYKNLLILGDSISTGYGLSGYSSSNPYSCASYGNRLASELGLAKNAGYVNKAVNGDMSSDLLALLPSLKNEIKKADLIIISIGGNDYLQKLGNLATMVTGKEYSSKSEAYEALAGLTDEQLSSGISDAEMLVFFNNILTEYKKNLDSIISTIKEQNPTARVIFLKQYNPITGVPGMEDELGFVASFALTLLNTKMEESVTEGGYELADVPSVIDDAAAARTNILLGDIHPNAAGHGEIYKLLSSMLAQPTDAGTLVTSEDATTAEVTTEEVTTAEVTTEAVTSAEVTTEAAATEEVSTAEAAATTSASDGKISVSCSSSVAALSALVCVLGGALVFRKKDN